MKVKIKKIISVIIISILVICLMLLLSKWISEFKNKNYIELKRIHIQSIEVNDDSMSFAVGSRLAFFFLEV